MNFLKVKLLIGVLFLQATIFAVPEPYASARNRPYVPYVLTEGGDISYLISTNKLSVIVDVGSVDGSIARYVAQQSQNLNTVKIIYSINEWSAISANNTHPFQYFLSNVKQENTSDLIVPIRMNSIEAASGLNIIADFIYLADLDTQNVYRDILAWYPHLSDGGIMAGNNWNETTIELGVAQAAETLNLIIRIIDNVWYFEKKQAHPVL